MIQNWGYTHKEKFLVSVVQVKFFRSPKSVQVITCTKFEKDSVEVTTCTTQPYKL